MQRHRFLALLLIAPLVAGCATSPEGAPPAADEPALASSVLPWTLSECTYIVGFTPVDEAAIAPYIPEGFTVNSNGLLGPAPVQRVSLGVEAFVCERGSGIDGEVADLEYGSIFVGVEPPAEMANDGSGFHMLKWDILVPDAPRRETLLAAGLPVHAGSATVEDLPGGARRGTLALDGFGTFVMEMAPLDSGAPSTDTPQFTEFTPSTLGGFAAWRANYAWDSDTVTSGRGTITWAEGTWAADVVGSTKAPGSFHMGTWSFVGNLTLPPP